MRLLRITEQRQMQGHSIKTPHESMLRSQSWPRIRHSGHFALKAESAFQLGVRLCNCN